ncbi:MAG: hypothetical protein ABEK12_00175, partial [Candidatus Nanohaloarchaea archaeon]
MRPEVTFLTSSELQEALGNSVDDDEMSDLQRFRDTVMDRFADHAAALEDMEEIWGRQWRRLFLRAWVVEGAGGRVSSPILLERRDTAETVFDAFVLLAMELIREDPPESDLVEPGYDGIDALATLLAVEALAES